MASSTKRLIICCDGTWMDSDDGYKKPTLIPYVPTGTLQVPSNVTRISRALTKIGLDGKPQIIYYQSGVGTGSSIIDTVTGGLLGKGISENVREVYSFITANYTPGDEIILVGFSRGAFTARSVAGMIREIGLLTREGMNAFYPIFKDQQNFRNYHYRDIFPTLPFSNKPKGEDAGREYKRRLLSGGLTRVNDPDGQRIKVQAVAVWDTVGSLGIPNIAFLTKLGLPGSTREYKFYDTNLSGNVRHAFQALALDEHRSPFSPAVWERNNMQKTTIDLRQVWFPGAHANVGGGYDDQGMANISLAWMMDQLASIGVAFQDEFIDIIFAQSVMFYKNSPDAAGSIKNLFSRGSANPQWARNDIYEKHRPVRPWGLGQIYESDTGIWRISGRICRSPGLYKRADPETGKMTTKPLTHTNERIHSSVRIRLDLDGMDVDDKGLYKCHALLNGGMWRLRKVRLKTEDPISPYASWGLGAPAPSEQPQPNDARWIWEYSGPEEDAPRDRILVEETLGPYERKLLLLNKGRESYNLHRKRRRRKSRNMDSAYSSTQYDRKQTYEDDEDSLTDDRAERVARRHSMGPRDGTTPRNSNRDSLVYGAIQQERRPKRNSVVGAGDRDSWIADQAARRERRVSIAPS